MSRFIKILLWFVVFQGVAVSMSLARADAGDGQNLFEKRCTACHKLPDPDQPPSKGWVEQLDLMAPLARLKKDQKQSVLDYLMSHSQQASMTAALDEDRIVFETKCSRCHTVDRVLLSPLRGESLRHVVNRMQSRSGTDWLSDRDVERVLSYLGTISHDTKSTAATNDGTAPAEIFAVRCSGCHTLERVFLNLSKAENVEDFWSHTVSRMRGKAPQWMSEADAAEILDYLRSLSPVPK
ncbi:MAG: c-type cytochrome [Proteobacteria bacterium]|nr:c-type cytochrome [Pseudomonadota bacterium]